MTMQDTITRLIVLESLVKEVHWNATGPGFIALHTYLDTVYSDCEQFIDELAEHVVADGTGTPYWVTAEFEHFPQPVVRNRPRDLTHGLHAVCALLTDLVESLDEHLVGVGDDPAGDDIIVRALQTFNKHLWLLSAEAD